ncbi:MAG TPA: PaaI family thioesterase [Methylomirabilota bacterium]|nr:PaaI family thioesterase [Methylomirabilota bacterium]
MTDARAGMTPPEDPGVGPFADLLGLRRSTMEDGRCRFEATVRPEHKNPHGVVHGGVVYTLVDYAMGGAVTSRLGPGERCATLEIKVNYLAPVSEGRLAAEAWVVAQTPRVVVLEARVRADGDRLIALATGSFYLQTARAARQ